MDKKKQNILIAVIVAAAAVLLLLAASSLISHIGKVGIKLDVIPSNATITIDGKNVKNGKVWVKPGKHTIKAHHQDFADMSKDIDTAKLGKDPVQIYLKPASEAGFDYLESHPDQEAAVESAASAQYNKQQDQINKYPLVQKLPYIANGSEFSVNYDAHVLASGDVDMIFNVTLSSEDAKADALEWIRDQGTDPSTLNIHYTIVPPDDTGIGHQ